MELRAPAGLPVGEYHGFVRFKHRGPHGNREMAVAVTLFVQAQATSKAITLVDAPMQALFPLPGGGYEPGTMRVTHHLPDVASLASNESTPT